VFAKCLQHLFSICVALSVLWTYIQMKPKQLEVGACVCIQCKTTLEYDMISKSTNEALCLCHYKWIHETEWQDWQCFYWCVGVLFVCCNTFWSDVRNKLLPSWGKASCRILFCSVRDTNSSKICNWSCIMSLSVLLRAWYKLQQDINCIYLKVLNLYYLWKHGGNSKWFTLLVAAMWYIDGAVYPTCKIFLFTSKPP
jgi:hypothetical protein